MTIKEKIKEFETYLDECKTVERVQDLGAFALMCVYCSNVIDMDERDDVTKAIHAAINRAIDRIDRLGEFERWLKKISNKAYAVGSTGKI